METFRGRSDRPAFNSDEVKGMRREITGLEARSLALEAAIKHAHTGPEIFGLHAQRDQVDEQVMEIQRSIWEAERRRWRPRVVDLADITESLERMSITIRIERIVSFYGSSRLDPNRVVSDEDGATENAT